MVSHTTLTLKALLPLPLPRSSKGLGALEWISQGAEELRRDEAITIGEKKK